MPERSRPGPGAPAPAALLARALREQPGLVADGPLPHALDQRVDRPCCPPGGRSPRPRSFHAARPPRSASPNCRYAHSRRWSGTPRRRCPCAPSPSTVQPGPGPSHSRRSAKCGSSPTVRPRFSHTPRMVRSPRRRVQLRQRQAQVHVRNPAHRQKRPERAREPAHRVARPHRPQRPQHDQHRPRHHRLQRMQQPDHASTSASSRSSAASSAQASCTPSTCRSARHAGGRRTASFGVVIGTAPSATARACTAASSRRVKR